jgi:pyruvate/2-oxoglutarate dehydrogenase complex dihydrolipoamide dehydrogenase (E3) component
MELLPADEYNRELLSQVRPADWTHPAPAGRYNLVAVGGGTAGIIAALGTAGIGGRAALIERHLLGGDCLNFGCVPSKALLRSARAAYDAATCGEFGCRPAAPPDVDFSAVMERMRRLRAGISHHDSAARFKSLGVDVYLGTAAFTGPRTIEVAGARLEFARAVIATGGRPAEPGIDGLGEMGYLTNETVFSLTALPRRLIVVGAGPIGCELAQAFRRFGSEVHLVQRRDILLPREEPAAAEVVREQFASEGVSLHLGWTPLKAERTGDARTLLIERGGERRKLIADEVLVAVGRRPNFEGLGLEAAGVAHTAAGITVDDFLRTTNRRIYAAGDVCSRHKFTHAADAQARLCVQNALFWPMRRASRLVIPRCTYTDPEVGQVGLTRAEAAEQGIDIDTLHVPMSGVDRAIVDGETAGFAEVYVRRGTGRVLGATVVARHAGDLLGEITLLMTRGLPLSALSSTIHSYPTRAEVWRKAADLHQRSRLTPRVAGWLRRWLEWRR